MHRHAGHRKHAANGQGSQIAGVFNRFDLLAGGPHGIVHVHRRLDALLRQAPEHHTNALGVIGVVVRDENSRKLGRIEARLVAAGKEIALADTAVHKHARTRDGVFHDGRIAAAAAGQHVQAQAASAHGAGAVGAVGLRPCRRAGVRPSASDHRFS